jgi:phosphatidylinositol alpha-1,6-mannosyltransferase
MRGWTYPRWRPALSILERTVTEFRPEAIICGKALFEGRAVRALRKKTPIPYVVMTYAMEVATWLRGWKTRADLHGVLTDASRVVVINDETKRLLHTHGVPDTKLVKIYPGVDDVFFERPAAVDEFRTRHGLENKRVLITTCRLVSRKGVDTVLDSLPALLREIPHLAYVVVGDGPERERLQAQADRLGIASHVRFLGRTSAEDLRSALSIADIFILTPRTEGTDMEGFGIAYLEAAATGVCSLGSRTGGVPEAVIHNETGLLVPQNDPTAVAGELRRLLTDTDLRARLATAAKKRAEKEFHWSQRALLFQGMMEAVVTEARYAKKEMQ